MEVSFHITTYGHIIDHILCIHNYYILYYIYMQLYTDIIISYHIILCYNVLYIQEVSLAADFSHKQISPDPAGKEQLNLLRRRNNWPLGYGGNRQAKPKSNHHFKVYRKLRQWSSLQMEPWHAGTRKTRWKHLSCNAASKTECMSHL